MTKEKKNKSLLQDLQSLVKETEYKVASAVNSAVTILFWKVGKRIRDETLNHQRAKYGESIVVTVSRSLVEQFGRNYEEKNLRRMIQFAEIFSDFEIVVTLSRQLSWSHFIVLIPLKSETARNYYTSVSFNNLLSVRQLKKQISTKSFERTIYTNQPLPEKSPVKNGIFKDPYFLDFLGLQTGYLEKDLESAILNDLEQFILELGAGFTFVERQKRMIIDGEDFNLDLLFYHRKLRRLIAIELKIDKFKANYKGQMELYLKWLNRYEKQEGENTPVGLILCTETSSEQIELLEMHKDGIFVAEYWTELPSKKLLESRLHKSMLVAKEMLDIKEDER